MILGRHTDVRLAEMSTQLAEANTQLAVISEQLRQVPDHETRLRSIERWRYGLPLAGLLSAASFFLAVYGWVSR